jgi:hypothetical protein
MSHNLLAVNGKLWKSLRRGRPSLLIGIALAICISGLLDSRDVAVANVGCNEKLDGNSTENRVRIAVCAGENITLNHGETITADFLTREITDQTYLDKLKDRGLKISGGVVLGRLDLRNRHFDLSSFKMSSTFEDAVDLSGSQFAGRVSLQDSTFRKGLFASRIVIGGPLLIGDSDDTQYDGARPPRGSYAMFIRAPHARVAGDVVISGATVGQEINISNSQIAGSLTMMYVAAEAVDFSASEIGNQLIFYNCAIETNGPSNEQNSYLNLYSIRTKQSVYIDRISVQNLSVEAAEIDGDLILLGSQLSSVNARSSNVSGSLSVGINDYTPERWTTWIGEATLDLANARLGGFRGPELLNSWPDHISFRNLLFKSFVPDFCGAPSCEHHQSWYRDWLSKQEGERSSFEPYKTVVDLLLSEGQVLEANNLAIVGHDAEREDAYEHGEWGRYLLLSAYRYSVGYGYQLYLVIIPIVFFTCFGALMLWATGEAKHQHMPIGLLYSFDMLLPIIRLREVHYKIDLKGCARYYFYVHKLIGWALGFTLIAALGVVAK